MFFYDAQSGTQIDLSTTLRPVPRHAGAGEMTILFEYSIPRFQERSAEPQIPPRLAGTGRLR